jgi:hypothetical protein
LERRGKRSKPLKYNSLPVPTGRDKGRVRDGFLN